MAKSIYPHGARARTAGGALEDCGPAVQLEHGLEISAADGVAALKHAVLVGDGIQADGAHARRLHGLHTPLRATATTTTTKNNMPQREKERVEERESSRKKTGYLQSKKVKGNSKD